MSAMFMWRPQKRHGNLVQRRGGRKKEGGGKNGRIATSIGEKTRN